MEELYILTGSEIQNIYDHASSVAANNATSITEGIVNLFGSLILLSFKLALLGLVIAFAVVIIKRVVD